MMTNLKEDVHLLLRLDEVHHPGREARKFVYSREFTEVAEAGTFFDIYALDSDERFFINEVATYYETLGMFWKKGIVDADLALEWKPAALYWSKLGSVLIKAREVFGIDNLWEDFEALAKAGMET